MLRQISLEGLDALVYYVHLFPLLVQRDRDRPLHGEVVQLGNLVACELAIDMDLSIEVGHSKSENEADHQTNAGSKETPVTLTAKLLVIRTARDLCESYLARGLEVSWDTEV